MKMKRIAFFGIGLVLLAGLAFSQSITVTSPNGGEIWETGNIHAITWTTSGISSGTYQVTLWKGGVSQGVVATGLPHTQHAINCWTVGSLLNAPDVAPGPGYTIKVRLQGEPPYDFSDAPFTITAPPPPAGSITVTSPNGGENWPQGFTHNITWTTGITQGTCKITVWQGSTNLGVVASGLPVSQKTFPWVVGKLVTGSVPLGSGYKIRVKLQDEPIWDESDNTFSIIIPLVAQVNKTITAKIFPKPDLIVCLDNTLRPAVATEAKIHAYVKNIGQYKSNPCALSFHVGGEGTETFSVPKLNPGETYTVLRKKRLYKSATRSIHATIDSNGMIAESNENNNYVESSVKWRLPHEDKYVVGPAIKCADGSTWNP